MIKLDTKDKRILYELDKNSRESYSNLGKKTRLSKGAVAYRMAQMEREGIIKKYHTLINRNKLGYFRVRLYINLREATPEKEDEIINFLSRKKMVSWMASLDGRYNLGIICTIKDIIEVEELWEELISKYINQIDERQLAIITRSRYFSRDYLPDKVEAMNPITEERDGKVEEIDKIDDKIIELLTQNARMPIVEIAHEIRATPKTIITHIKELRRKKIITGYRTEFELDKIGYQKFKVGFILLKTTQDILNAFIKYAKENPNVVSHQEVLGGDDVEVDIEVKDVHELRGIIDNFREKFAGMIHDYKILNVHKIHRKVFLPTGKKSD